MADIYDIQKEQKLREHLNESLNIPEETEQLLNEQLKGLKATKKRRGSFRLAVAIAAAVTLFAVTAVAVSGNNIQFIQNIINRWGGNATSEEFIQYMNETKITVEDQGYEVTLNGVYADAEMLFIRFDVHTDKKINRDSALPKFKQIKINGEPMFVGGSSGGLIVDEHNALGNITLGFDEGIILPEQFNLEIEMKNMSKIDGAGEIERGTWLFKLNVKRADIEADTIRIIPKNNTNTVNGIKFEVPEYVVTPLSTRILLRASQTDESKVDEFKKMNFDFIYLDEKDETINAKSTIITLSDEGVYQTKIFFTKKDTEFSKVTIVPYTYNLEQRRKFSRINRNSEQEIFKTLNFMDAHNPAIAHTINNLGASVRVSEIESKKDNVLQACYIEAKLEASDGLRMYSFYKCVLRFADGTMAYGIGGQGIANIYTDRTDLEGAQIAFVPEPDITLIENGAFTIDVSKK